MFQWIQGKSFKGEELGYRDCVKRNLFYIGIVLVVLGLGVGFVAPGSVIPSLFPSPASQSVSVAAGSVGNLPIQLNESGLIVLTFNSISKINFYVANATAFGAIGSAGANATRTALGLEGNGVYEVYENSTSGAFPYAGYQNTTAPNYLLNVSAMPAGTYYAAFYNGGNATAQVGITYLAISISKIQNGEASVGNYLAIAAVLFVVGVGLTVYSFIAKDTSKEQAATDAEAAKEYAKLDKKGKRGSKR